MITWEYGITALLCCLLTDANSVADDGNATLVLLTEAAQKDGAVCIDGTPAAIYLHPGSGSGQRKWIVHHEGGGWCENLEQCFKRSKASLGSSKDYLSSVPVTALMKGDYLSQDPSVNPMMHNWNVAYLKYCDGGSFTGNNSTITTYKGAKMYFRGFRILRAMQAYLLQHQLQESTDVVITGNSAGGLATYLHLDDWAVVLEAPGRTVVGMPDSGFFPYYGGTDHFSSGMHWVFHHMNSTGGVHPDCIAEHAPLGTSEECFFAEHAVRYIRTRAFALQSEYDSDQIGWAGIEANDTSRINQWGAHVRGLLQNNFLSSEACSKHGVFLDSCFHHCWGWGTFFDGSINQPQAFQEWYEKGSELMPNKGFFQQDSLYPCKSCCDGTGLVRDLSFAV